MTLFMVLEAAVSILVSRWTGDHDVLVSTPIPSETEPGTADILGCVIHTIALRSRVNPWASLDDALRNARQTCLRAFAHEDQAFEDICGDPSPARGSDMHRTPSFAFALIQTAPEMNPHDPNVTGGPRSPTTFQHDLTFIVYDNGDDHDLHALLAYDTDLFDESSTERFAAQWRRLLRSMADDPSRLLCELDLMSDDERRTLLAAGDRFAQAAPFVPITTLIADAFQRYADEVALACGANRLTFRDLGWLTRELTEQIERYGLRQGEVIAVAVERSTDLVVAQLAVLCYGAVLLPIDVDQPPRRIDAMLSDAHARLVLASDAGAIGLTNLLPVLDVTTALANVPDAPAVSPPGFAPIRPDDGSYILFTSGSTGRPKGVYNTHAGIANRIAWMQDTYHLTPGDRVLYKTPVGFDVAMWEWLWPVTAGATVVIADSGAHQDPAALARIIAGHSVTITHFIPSMLRLFAAQPEAQQCQALRKIICSGEELTAVAVEEALRICPSVDNLYGPTEAAIDVTQWVCGRGEAPVPIGRPISGVRLRVVDETGSLVPVGVPGELLIGGVALARGYAFRPGLTARAFIPDSWHEGARLYRTGDRVRWREHGVLEFLGRLDAQVKIRGVRVEPGEIESVLATHPGVVEGAVVVHADEHRGVHLVAYVSGSAAPADLRRHLRSALPEVMVPTVIEKLGALPRTTSGKIDRVGLATTLRPPVGLPSEGPRAE